MIDTGDFNLHLPVSKSEEYQSNVGKSVVFGIRPEDIHNPVFIPPNIHTENVTVKVDVTELMGNEILLYLLAGENPFVARVDPRTDFKIGEMVDVAFNMDNFHLFDAETEEAIC